MHYKTDDKEMLRNLGYTDSDIERLQMWRVFIDHRFMVTLKEIEEVKEYSRGYEAQLFGMDELDDYIRIVERHHNKSHKTLSECVKILRK